MLQGTGWAPGLRGDSPPGLTPPQETEARGRVEAELSSPFWPACCSEVTLCHLTRYSGQKNRTPAAHIQPGESRGKHWHSSSGSKCWEELDRMQGPVHCDNHVQHSQGLRQARNGYPWTTSFREASLRSQPDTQPGLPTSGLGSAPSGIWTGSSSAGHSHASGTTTLELRAARMLLTLAKLGKPCSGDAGLVR